MIIFMANRKMVEEMLGSFSAIWDRTITDAIINAYFKVLRFYKDEEIQQVGYKALDTLKYFPKPAELVELMKKSKHDKEFKEHWQCPVCKADVACIIEGKCRYCNAKLPLNIPRPTYKQKPDNTKGFDIGYETRCEKCGKISTCIHELPEDYWQCRECYSGLTNDEYSKKMRDIIDMIEDKVIGL